MKGRFILSRKFICKIADKYYGYYDEDEIFYATPLFDTVEELKEWVKAMGVELADKQEKNREPGHVQTHAPQKHKLKGEI